VLGASFLISCFLICQATLVHCRENRSDRMAVGSDGQIDIHEYLFQPHSVGILERPLQQWFCYFKSDKLLIRSGGVATLGRLKNIKCELRLGVGIRIVRIGYQRPELQSKLRVET